jgi:hypothetical protein
MKVSVNFEVLTAVVFEGFKCDFEKFDECEQICPLQASWWFPA